MKKVLLIGLMLILVGCGDNSKQDNIAANKISEVESKQSDVTNSNINKSNDNVMDAEEVVKSFKDKGLPVGQIIVYDEKTDPNKLLNRPNQYTQKVAFEVTTIEQPSPEFLTEGDQPFNGGTIEVFPNAELAESRKSYIEEVTADMPMLQQYIYVNDNAVLRLDHDVLPSDAEKYNQIFQQ